MFKEKSLRVTFRNPRKNVMFRVFQISNRKAGHAEPMEQRKKRLYLNFLLFSNILKFFNNFY